MDPLRLIVALVPLAIYLLWIGFVNLRRRSCVVSGARDALLLGLGLMGLVLIGPLELLLPESTAFRFGGYAWLMLGSFYLLTLVMAVMAGRPRIVIYNSDLETIRPALARVVRKMDDGARWAGDSVVLPTIGTQIYLDRYAMLRNVQVRAIGHAQPYSAWTVLEKELRGELKQIPSDRGAWGFTFIVSAAAILALVTMTFLHDQGEIARSFEEMLRR